MHINKKHRRSLLNVSALRWSRGISLMVLCVSVLFAQADIFAGAQSVERHVISGESGILIKSGDDGAVVISEGRIAATEGYSLRMLPGTHIKGGEEISVSIVSKEHHEQLAAEVAREKRQETAESILAQRDEMPAVPDADTIFRNLQPTSGSSTIIGQQLAAIAVMPVRTQSSQVAHTVILHKHIPFFNIHNHHAVTFRPVYVPDLSWGERAESIGVMLA